MQADKDKMYAEVLRLASAETLSTATAGIPGHRASLQNFEALPDFLTTAVWENLRAGETEEFFKHLVTLGLRNPSEPTKQVIACILMAASKGMDGALELSGGMKTQMCKTGGQLFSRYVSAHRENPTEDIRVLPATPAELKATHPETFKKAFGGSPAVPCIYEKLAFAELRRTTKMRQTKTGNKGLPCLQGLPGQGVADPTASLVQGLVPALMQAVQAFMPANSNPGLSLRMETQPRQPTRAQSLLDLQPPTHTPRTTANVEERIASLSAQVQNLEAVKAQPAEEQTPAKLPLMELQTEAGNDSSDSQQDKAGGKTDVEPPPVAKGEGLNAGSGTKRRASVASAALAIMNAYDAQKVAKKSNGDSQAKVAKKSHGDSPPVAMKRPAAAKGKVQVGVSHEASRSQFLAKIEKVPGQKSKAFKYKSQAEQAKAKALAVEYCRKVCDDSGLEYPTALA